MNNIKTSLDLLVETFYKENNIEIDEALKESIAILNSFGVETNFCCEGHKEKVSSNKISGYISFANYLDDKARELFIKSYINVFGYNDIHIEDSKAIERNEENFIKYKEYKVEEYDIDFNYFKIQPDNNIIFTDDDSTSTVIYSSSDVYFEFYYDCIYYNSVATEEYKIKCLKVFYNFIYLYLYYSIINRDIVFNYGKISALINDYKDKYEIFNIY